MELRFANNDDLNRLLNWCAEAPEFYKKLPHYMDRDDTAVLMMENDDELIGIALLKVKVTEKSGTVWLHLNKEGTESHPQIMQKSLNWLRQKGAKDYTVM
jgi:hypothetical protein